MTYKKIGYSFHQIRKQKKFSLSDFSVLGISKSTLSRFERGENMMGFEKVNQALQLMGVSLKDYEYILNNYLPDESEVLLKEIEVANYKYDQTKLEELYHLSNNLDRPYIAIAAKASFTHLNEEEIYKITEYLYEIKLWSFTDIYLIYFIIEDLRLKDLLYLINLFFLEDNYKLIYSSKNKFIIARIYCRALVVLSVRGYQHYGKLIIKIINSINLIDSVFTRNLYNFSLGFWLYCFSDKDRGETLIIKSLNYFHSISTKDIAVYYQKRYNDFIKTMNE